MYPKELNSDIPKRTHWMNLFRNDYLSRVLDKLQELLDSHEAMCQNEGWYDETFLFEDQEETLDSQGDVKGNQVNAQTS